MLAMVVDGDVPKGAVSRLRCGEPAVGLLPMPGLHECAEGSSKDDRRGRSLCPLQSHRAVAPSSREG